MFTYPIHIHLPVRFEASPDGRGVVLIQESYDFSVRTISRREWRIWSLEHPQYIDLEDRILAAAVLTHPDQFHGQPWDWEVVSAGLVDRLVKEILHLSGFGPQPSALIVGRAEQYLAGEEAKFDLMILTAFGYTLDQLWDMDPETWQCTVGLACQKLALMGIDPQAIIDPDGFKKKTQKMDAIQAAQQQAGQYVGRGVEVSQQSTGFQFNSE